MGHMQYDFFLTKDVVYPSLDEWLKKIRHHTSLAINCKSEVIKGYQHHTLSHDLISEEVFFYPEPKEISIVWSSEQLVYLFYSVMIVVINTTIELGGGEVRPMYFGDKPALPITSEQTVNIVFQNLNIDVAKLDWASQPYCLPKKLKALLGKKCTTFYTSLSLPR